MDFDSILTEAFSAGVIAPLVSLIVLPIIYRFVGITKRERREREQAALRMTMDLARGLKELAEATSDPRSRQEYQSMRNHVLADFFEKAKAHFDEERNLIEHPETRYWLLPRPRGLFGGIWAVLTVALSAIGLMLMVGVVIAIYQDTETEPHIMIISAVILMILILAPVFLFRWFAFISARIGQPTRGQAQSQAQ